MSDRLLSVLEVRELRNQERVRRDDMERRLAAASPLPASAVIVRLAVLHPEPDMTVDSKEMPAAMADLLSLVEHEIPDGRQSLRDSHINLTAVADYCEDNYFRAENKRVALEETKNYTTQSLASVAYQINTLAYNLLSMLDLQATQMADMESQINHISQTVAIHKEKVARREIGVLTTNKVNARQHKILVPANPERAVKYIRKPIDFSLLDDVGHGVKLPNPQQMRTKRGSIPGLTAGPNGSAGHHMIPAPTTKPPTPPQPGRGMGTLSRGSKEYRTPAPPIAPPQVPSNYAPNFPIAGQHLRSQDTLSRRGSGYSALPLMHSAAAAQYSSGSSVMRQTSSESAQSQSSGQLPTGGMAQIPPPPPQQPVGTVHPMSQGQTDGSFVNPSPTPPPPPPVSGQDQVQTSASADSLPPPPQPQSGPISEQFGRPNPSRSPPLPPPPSGMADESGSSASDANDWIPRKYLEKVIAIYDYAAARYDELSFQENAVIYVVKKNDDGWYEGVLNGITGLFPGNYVEPCL